jgi:hypothetical protein
MKISELLNEAPQMLQIEKDDDKETTLVDPNTKVKTIVPKDPKKPGMIAKDETGKLTLDTKTTGSVDRGIRPGDRVQVKQ